MQLQLLSLGFSSFQCCSGVTPASKELSCKGKKGTSEESGDSFKSYFGDQPSVFFCQTWLCLLIKGNNMRAWSACESKNLGLETGVKWKLNNGSAHECMQQKGGNFLRNIKVMSPSNELSWKRSFPNSDRRLGESKSCICKQKTLKSPTQGMFRPWTSLGTS